MYDASMPNPDILTISCLAEGYILTFQGKSIALPDPAYAAIRIQDLLTTYERTRGTLPNRVDYTPVKSDFQAPKNPQNQTPPNPPTPAPEANVPVYDVTVSRANLQNLVRRRVAGEVRNDATFFAYVNQYCPGIDEDEAVSALDDAMADSPTNLLNVQDDSVEVVGIRQPKNLDDNMFEMTPQDMIQDYVVDDATGLPVSDDELQMLASGMARP